MSASFILDASVAMSWCFEDEMDEYSQNILNNIEQFNALVPALFFIEVSNVLVLSEKRNRLTAADSTRFVDILDRPCIGISDLIFSIQEITNMARYTKLTSYDVIYLMLAMHTGLPIATKDNALKNVCLENGVSFFTP